MREQQKPRKKWSLSLKRGISLNFHFDTPNIFKKRERERDNRDVKFSEVI
jgi:hypothetical protein